MKSYFEDEDSEMAYPESYFQEQMKENNITEMTVIEAVKQPYSKADFVWCMFSGSCSEKSDCNKNCEEYSPENGKNGKCKHRGQYCEFGKEVTLHLTNISKNSVIK